MWNPYLPWDEPSAASLSTPTRLVPPVGEPKPVRIAQLDPLLASAPPRAIITQIPGRIEAHANTSCAKTVATARR